VYDRFSQVLIFLAMYGVSCSDAGPCSTEIASIDIEMTRVESPPSGETQLSKPSTPGARVRSEMRTDPRFVEAMERARLLDSENSPACMKIVREVRNLLGM
jgi:hypothetical protein